MTLSVNDVIFLIKSIGENLKLGRSLENSIFYSYKNLLNKDKEKEELLKRINLGENYSKIFSYLEKETSDKSLSRVWNLVEKIVKVSSIETGEKMIEIANNLEKNRILSENRNNLIKSQRYKIIFLGSVTSLFLGVIAALAPLFATFAELFRNLTISQSALILIPISLYTISEFSIYFLADISLNKYNYRYFIFSSLIYICSFLITKGVINIIL
ncbi:MAG TPA: hypothetical protein VMX55_15255 [candidate division Zixibacteria bacterium]|nr:hypothetical protein [candidate division Zixibacteria bacterium]